MKKGKRIIAAVLCVSICICGCAPKKEEEHKTEEEKKLEAPVQVEEKEYQGMLDMIEPAAYRDISGLKLEPGSYLSVIGKGSGGEYWEQVKKGAEQAVADLNAELGYQGKDEIKVTYSGPAEEGNVDEQVNILDEELARYPVGLSIAIADAKACGVQFDLAASNGIPIVALDSGSDYQGLMATVSTDNRGTAQMAAEKMAGLIGNAGEVIVLVQDSKSMSALERENGFVEKIQSDYPEIKIAEIYRMDQTEEKQKEIAKKKKLENPEEISEEEILDYILEKNPEVKGIFATDGTAVEAAVEALSRAENETAAVIGYDGNKAELEALKNGKADGLIIQNPFGMGYASIIASVRAALSMGNEAYVNTGATWKGTGET